MAKTQAEKRKDRRALKEGDRSSDVVSVRGYSTDQRISIENMSVNIRRLEHQKKETKLVGLSIQVSAIEAQIKSAENRALIRCPEYKESNVYWQRVDALMQQETNCVLMINKYNNEMLTENETPQSNVTQVSEFLNQPSPVKKKRAFHDLVGVDDDVVAFDINDEGNFDDDNVGMVDKHTNKKKGKKKAIASDDNDSDDSNEDNGYKVKKEKMVKAKKKANTTRVSKRRTKGTRRR